MVDNYASRGRYQSEDDKLQHQGDDGEPDVRGREVPEEEAPDGDRSSPQQEAGDVEPSSDPPKKKVVVWIARSPTFHGEPHYEIGIDFD